jgi:formylglycine-generating enzyme required for sulfatase activity
MKSLFHREVRSIAVVMTTAIVLLSSAAEVAAGMITFGVGAQQFQMEFVTIGNPGNLADTDINALPLSAGAVAYSYDIGKFEVSEDMITKFNASQSLQITKDARGANKPATSVSWNEAARFVNWLNTSTGNPAAYKFTTGGVNDNIALWTSGDAGYDASNQYRNSLAKYFLPNSNEWYKAAYYNPNDSTYYDFANGSNTAPTSVASGSAAGTAVYGQLFGQGPADVDQAGGLSPYGVMGLGGNVYEWEESSFDLQNSSGSSSRGIRGGDWNSGSSDLSSSTRYIRDPSLDGILVGFRVASLSASPAAAVPEPGTLLLGTLLGLGGYLGKRRMKK